MLSSWSWRLTKQFCLYVHKIQQVVGILKTLFLFNEINMMRYSLVQGLSFLPGKAQNPYSVLAYSSWLVQPLQCAWCDNTILMILKILTFTMFTTDRQYRKRLEYSSPPLIRPPYLPRNCAYIQEVTFGRHMEVSDTQLVNSKCLIPQKKSGTRVHPNQVPGRMPSNMWGELPVTMVTAITLVVA